VLDAGAGLVVPEGELEANEVFDEEEDGEWAAAECVVLDGVLGKRECEDDGGGDAGEAADAVGDGEPRDSDTGFGEAERGDRAEWQATGAVDDGVDDGFDDESDEEDRRADEGERGERGFVVDEHEQDAEGRGFDERERDGASESGERTNDIRVSYDRGCAVGFSIRCVTGQ
jgi:hypothetical protein